MTQPPKLGLNEDEIAESKSVTRRLEELLPELERLLGAGVRRQTVLDALNQQGFNLSMSSFATMLKRLRKRGTRTVPPAGGSAGGKAERSSDIKSHSRQVHEQFKNITDRPRKVHHDLTTPLKW